MLEYIANRVSNYDTGYFVNELATASKNLGILEAKIDSYQFNSILIPMLQKKEAISSICPFKAWLIIFHLIFFIFIYLLFISFS